MAGTIIPIVHGERQRGRPPAALWLHTIGCLVGAISIGSLFGVLGSALPWQAAPGGRKFVVLAATGFVSLLYSVHEIRLVRLPAPQCQWQVPATWRSHLPLDLAALLYGLGLGIGLVTRIPVSTFYAAVLGVVLVGNPVLSALIMAAFGLGRALPLICMAWLLDSSETNFRLTEVLHRWKPVVHLLNGLALSCAGSCLMVAALKLH